MNPTRADNDDRLHRRGVQEQSRMIIEPVDDLNIAAIGKAPVSEIVLPGLIGLHRLGALDVSAAPLLGLRGERP